MIAASKPERSASTPPTTLVPPPNGTTATPDSSQIERIRATSSPEPGATTASGADSSAPDRSRIRSG